MFTKLNLSLLSLMVVSGFTFQIKGIIEINQDNDSITYSEKSDTKINLSASLIKSLGKYVATIYHYFRESNQIEVYELFNENESKEKYFELESKYEKQKKSISAKLESK